MSGFEFMSLINDDEDDDERGMLHVPWPGCFIAFSIDPAATLRYYCHGGDTVAKVQNLVCKQYAAYCSQWSGGLPDSDAVFNRMWLRPIQIGLTKPRPNRMDKFKHKTADMCIPILPTTDHPLGRTPLPISHPLPWSNCYQPTMDDFDVLVEPQNYEYSDTPRFSSAVDSAITRYTSEDVKRINAMEAEYSVSPLEVQGPVVNNNTSDSDSDSIESVGDYAPSFGDDIDAVENSLFSSVNAPMWSKIFTPAIKINSDLGVIKVLSDPVELWDEHAALKRLVDECKARQRAASRPLEATCGQEVFPRSRRIQTSLLSSFSQIRVKFRRTKTKIVQAFRLKTAVRG
ncbi:hypothetical protein CPB85DRAFT_1454624 [Mucidula mucida]|nr:hypothetical protein CPB85DRAFT_1454624 [Mucidula mucida]